MEHPKIPRVGVERYLKKGYSTLVKRYKKLLHVMTELGVADDYHFRVGLESATDRAVKQLCEDACIFWGSAVVNVAALNSDISGWRLLIAIKAKEEDKG